MALIVLLHNTVQYRFITTLLHGLSIGTDEQEIAVTVYLFECRLLFPFQHSLKGFLGFLAHRHVVKTALCLWFCYVEAALVLEQLMIDTDCMVLEINIAPCQSA